MDSLGRLRAIAASLPEAYEEQAWVGHRWRIRTRTFAHLLDVEDGKPEAYARAAGVRDGTVLTLRASADEVAAFKAMGPPYFFGGWGRDAVGIRIDDTTDWAEIAELVAESYRLLAPQRLSRALGPAAPPAR